MRKANAVLTPALLFGVKIRQAGRQIHWHRDMFKHYQPFAIDLSIAVSDAHRPVNRMNFSTSPALKAVANLSSSARIAASSSMAVDDISYLIQIISAKTMPG